MLTTQCRLALRLRMSGALPLLALYAVMWQGQIFFSTGFCSAWCPVGPLNYVLRTEVIAYLLYSAGVNNLQFYAHSSYWDFVKCCLGTDSAPLICVFMFCFVFVHVSVFTDALRNTMLKVPRCLSHVCSGPTPWWRRLWTWVSIHSWRDHEV